MDTFQNQIDIYENTELHNDLVWSTFAEKTNDIDFLKKHRDFIEINQLGFGDRAFHYMWYLMVIHVLENSHKPKFLEIGVYKGQVISLWALIAKKHGLDIEIFAISPFEGNVSKNKWLNNLLVNQIRCIFSKKYRHDKSVGNLHMKLDYSGIINSVFQKFALDINFLHKIKGFSNEKNIFDQVKEEIFDLVYIDGDHAYQTVLSDIYNYATLVKQNGFLVMDDASYFLPGTQFWKGYWEVSKACEEIESLGFRNVLNVGHNRVYQRI